MADAPKTEELAAALDQYAECMTARGRDDLRHAAARLRGLERVRNIAEQFDNCLCAPCVSGRVAGCVHYIALHAALGEVDDG